MKMASPSGLRWNKASSQAAGQLGKSSTAFGPVIWRTL